MGWLKIGFCYAFHYLWNQTPYDVALRDIILKGGDTDTNAAIVGGLLGAYYGLDGIPEEWVKKVMGFCESE